MQKGSADGEFEGVQGLVKSAAGHQWSNEHLGVRVVTLKLDFIEFAWTGGEGSPPTVLFW